MLRVTLNSPPPASCPASSAWANPPRHNICQRLRSRPSSIFGQWPRPGWVPGEGRAQVSARGRGLAEDPGLGASAGLSTLPLGRLLSTLSAGWSGLHHSGGRSCCSCSSLPSIPSLQVPEFARHGSPHCGSPALGSQGELKGGSAPWRAGWG